MCCTSDLFVSEAPQISKRQQRGIHGVSPCPNHPILQSFVNIFGNSPVFEFMAYSWVPVMRFHHVLTELFRKFTDLLRLLSSITAKSEIHQFFGIHSPSLSSSRLFLVCFFFNFFGNPPTSTAIKFHHITMFVAETQVPIIPFRQVLICLWGCFPNEDQGMGGAPIVLSVRFCQLLQKAADFEGFNAPLRVPVVLFRQILPTFSEIRQFFGIHGALLSANRLFSICFSTFSEIRRLLRLLNSIKVIYLWFEACPCANFTMSVAHFQAQIILFCKVLLIFLETRQFFWVSWSILELQSCFSSCFTNFFGNSLIFSTA